MWLDFVVGKMYVKCLLVIFISFFDLSAVVVHARLSGDGSIVTPRSVRFDACASDEHSFVAQGGGWFWLRRAAIQVGYFR